MYCIYPPDKDGYAYTELHEVHIVELPGGMARFRKTSLNNSQNISVKWTCNKEIYDYIMNLYFNVTLMGTGPFTVDLDSKHNFTIETCEVYFVPGSVKLDSVMGETFTISAQLTLSSNEINDFSTVEDETFMSNYEQGLYEGLV